MFLIKKTCILKISQHVFISNDLTCNAISTPKIFWELDIVISSCKCYSFIINYFFGKFNQHESKDVTHV